MSKTVLIFIGTRPEAIKMAPLALTLKEQGFKVQIGLSGQHQDMVAPILDFFGLKADFNLETAKKCQQIEDTLALGMQLLCQRLREQPVSMILIHGDTSTTFAGAMAGYYLQIPVGHIEAGLRSGSMSHPFPEEANRKLTACLSSLHFSPTLKASENLKAEGVPATQIIQTGNTVVDAALRAKAILDQDLERSAEIAKKFSFLDPKKKVILMTGHRRENLNESLPRVVNATRELALRSDAQIVFPVHPNPKIAELLEGLPQEDQCLFRIKPLNYDEMIWLYSRLALIVTDSGGIQEEAASFRIPVLVTRKVTERKESIGLGLSHIVGDSHDLIVNLGLHHLFTDQQATAKDLANPYGDGLACLRIAETLKKEFGMPLSPKVSAVEYNKALA